MQESGLMDGQYNSLSPLMIIGVIFFCIPVIGIIVGWTVPGIIKTICTIIGILLILVGAAQSIFSASN